jgi:hypothetical protein
MLTFEEISHKKALEWLNLINFRDEFHESFNYWMQHIFLCRKQFPQIKKFIKSQPNWLCAKNNEEIVAVYFYTIVNREMFDGHLISHPDFQKGMVGYKLAKFLPVYTKDLWDINYSTCIKKYLNFNLKLGYKQIDDPFISEKYNAEVYLLMRKK